MQQRSQSVELTADGEVKAVERRFEGLIGTTRRMWKREGLRGFGRGLIPNTIRVAPSSAITFVVYEAVVDWLQIR
jgi:hypothetical protein